MYFFDIYRYTGKEQYECNFQHIVLPLYVISKKKKLSSKFCLLDCIYEGSQISIAKEKNQNMIE